MRISSNNLNSILPFLFISPKQNLLLAPSNSFILTNMSVKIMNSNNQITRMFGGSFIHLKDLNNLFFPFFNRSSNLCCMCACKYQDFSKIQCKRYHSVSYSSNFNYFILLFVVYQHTYTAISFFILWQPQVMIITLLNYSLSPKSSSLHLL